MARPQGTIYDSGTIDGMTFYRMEGKYYTRRKTSLSKERVLTNKAFERSRTAARVFGEASKLASEEHGMLTREQRKHGLIGKLSRAANRRLHQGMDKVEVVLVLLREYAGMEVEAMGEKKPSPREPVKPSFHDRQLQLKTTLIWTAFLS
jgi:hypothetical protein